MKIVIAPDSFKGTLTAKAAAEAISRGVSRILPEAEIDLCPMADGGEGTVDALAICGPVYLTEVMGPTGEPVEARFSLQGGRAIAILEMASASGLPLVPDATRDPLRTTSYGTGELIRAALDCEARVIVLGAGGSATVDGGTGCLQALGVVFLDLAGEVMEEPPTGGMLSNIGSVELGGLDSRLEAVKVRVACDVENPLLGAGGAAAVFGPQKGADPAGVSELERGLAHLADLLDDDGKLRHTRGTGAAGGLAFGLAAALGAELTPGFPLVAGFLRLRNRLTGADLCITGEGQLDAQSSRGKTAAGVARLCRDLAVPVACIPGVATDDAPVELFDQVRPIVGPGVGIEDAMAHPEPWLGRRGAEVAARLAGIE